MSVQQGRRRVVITGIGAVTPLGLDVESSWRGIREGRSGVSCVEGFEGNVRIAAQVKDFDPTQFMEHRTARKTDRFAHFAVAAASGDPIALARMDGVPPLAAESALRKCRTVALTWRSTQRRSAPSRSLFTR